MSKQEYIKKNEALFKKWKNESNAQSFVTDGIVDPDTWFGSEHKDRILIIIKEAYIKKDNPYDWDLTKWIQGEQCCANRECGKSDCNDCKITGATYNPIAKWVYAINQLNKGNFNCYDNWEWLGVSDKNSKAFNIARKSLLSQIAIINIKKADGQPTSNKDDLYYNAARDKDFLKQQIELINPDIIICGGTYNYLRCVYTELNPLNEPGENYEETYTTMNNIRIYALPHPNAHKSSKEKFKNIYRQYKLERD